jgi:hypothetical protein
VHPGTGTGKKSGFGSRMNNPWAIHISESLKNNFWVKKYFDADPGSGMENLKPE